MRPQTTVSKALQPLFDLDREIASAAKGVRILSTIAWPQRAIDDFLTGWRAGNPRLPAPDFAPATGLPDCVAKMEDVMRRTPQDHPLGKLLWQTAWSFATAARMLDSRGTPAFSECSIELYGRPDRKRPTQAWSDLEAAEFVLAKSAALLASCAVPDVVNDITAEDLATMLRARIEPVFGADTLAVEVTPELASKAAAGGRRVRLRADALFSELDLEQLFQHEVMVHAATMLNGVAQPALTVLGMGTPRTTRTQEGLATLAEITTGAMDLMRLRRIALRVRAVAMALGGADFLDLFRMFLEEGQSEEESAQSAARIFRGGDPRGSIPFTKDGVYIAGLIEVHTFLRLAVRDGRPELIPHLFAGRMTLGDAVILDELFQSGVLLPPRIVPTWAADLRRLTASITFSTFLDHVDLRGLTLANAANFDLRAIKHSTVAREMSDASQASLRT